MLLSEIIGRNARRWPERTAMVFGQQYHSFGLLNSHANSLARAMTDRGVKVGERVAILADNSLEYVEVMAAAAKAGWVLMPVNTRLTEEEVGFILEDAEASALFISERYREVIKAVRHRLGNLRHIISITDGEGESYRELLLASAADFQAPVTEADHCLIAYTGGTTGLPKGAMFNHRNMIVALVDGIATFGYSRRDKGLVCFPMFHIGGLYTVLVHFYLGAAVVLMTSFEPRAVLEAVQEERVTTLTLANPMLIALLNHPDIHRYDLSSLRCVLLAGTALPAEILKQAVEIFGHVIYSCYSLTEAITCVTTLLPEDMVLEGPPELVQRLASCGREDMDIEVKVVDEEGNPVAPGQVGEVIVRGDCTTQGYWKQPIRTAEALRGGWLYTSDLATVDDGGYVYLYDRKADTITTGGHVVSSTEIEDVIYRHPGVQEAAVIGIPDIELGNAIVAVVIPKQGQAVDRQQVLALCHQNLPGYAMPRTIEVIDSLPRNPLGKVLKRSLRERFVGLPGSDPLT